PRLVSVSEGLRAPRASPYTQPRHRHGPVHGERDMPTTEPAPSRRPRLALLLAATLPALLAAAQDERVTAPAAREMHKRYREEHAALLKDGIAKRYPAHQLVSAEVTAKRADAALAAGRPDSA